MGSTASPLRGDIWRIDFGPGRGSEQAGVRPAVVIQNDAGNRSLRYPNTVILAVSKKGRPIPFHIRLDPTERNGLSVTSYVKCEQILTISKSRLHGTKRLGRLSGAEVRLVESAVKRSLQLP